MLKKLQTLTQNRTIKKIFALSMCLVFGSAMMIPFVSATGEGLTDVAPSEAASQVFGFMRQQLNFTTILSVLGVVIGAALAMVLGWWAIRKIAKALMSAFKGGRLSV